MRKTLILTALLVSACAPKDEVVYIVTSPDKQAEIRIPEEAIPRGVDILDIALEKTGDTYTVTPTDVVFLKDIEFRSNNAQVVRVIDGDTIVVRLADDSEEHVRIVGIDATEKGECYAEEATKRLEELLQGKTVTLQINSQGDDRDTYGRLLRYVLVGGTDIGATLLQEGYVKNYPWFTHMKMDTYKDYETKAKANAVGLWATTPCPLP